MDQTQTIHDLIRQLKARPWKSRQDAVDQLVEIGEPAVLPLLDAFTLPDANKVDIAHALGRIGDLRAVEPLIASLDTSDFFLTQAAAKALGKLGDARAIYPLIGVFRYVWDDIETITIWQEAANALAAIGDTSFAPLVTALHDEDENMRIWAMEALKHFPAGHSIEPLLPSLHDPSFQVRAQAVEAIGDLGDLRSLDVLLPLLQDESDYVRVRVCSSIGNRGSQKGYDALVAALHDSSAEVRSAAAFNIGKVVINPLKIGQTSTQLDKQVFFEPVESQRQQATVLLLATLNDPSPQVRSAAASALGKIGDEKVTPVLQRIQQNDTGYVGANKVSSAATRAIEQIQKRYPTR